MYLCILLSYIFLYSFYYLYQSITITLLLILTHTHSPTHSYIGTATTPGNTSAMLARSHMMGSVANMLPPELDDTASRMHTLRPYNQRIDLGECRCMYVLVYVYVVVLLYCMIYIVVQ